MPAGSIVVLALKSLTPVLATAGNVPHLEIGSKTSGPAHENHEILLKKIKVTTY